MESLAEKFKRVYGDRAKEVKIKLLHQKEVWDYVMSIEEAHKRAAHSKTMFP